VAITADFKIRIVDLDEWGESVDPLLFSWQELATLAGDRPEILPRLSLTNRHISLTE
jgi:hypothetical protein